MSRRVEALSRLRGWHRFACKIDHRCRNMRPCRGEEKDQSTPRVISRVRRFTYRDHPGVGHSGSLWRGTHLKQTRQSKREIHGNYRTIDRRAQQRRAGSFGAMRMKRYPAWRSTVSVDGFRTAKSQHRAKHPAVRSTPGEKRHGTLAVRNARRSLRYRERRLFTTSLYSLIKTLYFQYRNNIIILLHL
jgi:hypothetical protein